MSRNIPLVPGGPDDPPGVIPAWFASSADGFAADSLMRGAGPPVPEPGGRMRLVVREYARARSMRWMAHGACRGTDPELFFPVAFTGAAAEQVSSAKAVCGRCQVRENCLSYALRAMPHGIWGGTTRQERIAMRAPLAARPRAQVEGACD
jgi:WhiB family transcriptional regulator, redox-sensing transcriptional regulator